MAKKKPLDQFVEDLLVTQSGIDAADAEGRAAMAPAEAEEAGPEGLALEYVANYLALKAQIADLEIRAGVERQAVIDALGVDGSVAGKQWVYAQLGTVSVVKGRVTEKLDRAKLARAGVSVEVLDGATVRTEGAPSVRISPWTGSPKDVMAANGWTRPEEERDAA